MGSSHSTFPASTKYQNDFYPDPTLHEKPLTSPGYRTKSQPYSPWIYANAEQATQSSHLMRDEAAIAELQIALARLDPSFDPQFRHLIPAKFQEKAIVRRGKIVLSEGVRIPGMSPKKMDVSPTWAESIFVAGEDGILEGFNEGDEWKEGGVGEFAEELWDLIAVVLERMGVLNEQDRFENLQLNEEIKEIRCGPWTLKNIVIKKNAFKGFVINVFSVKEVVISHRIVMKDLNLTRLAACLTRGGAVYIFRTRNGGEMVRQACERARGIAKGGKM